LAFVRTDHPVRVGGVDDRGPESVGREESLDFVEGAYVLTESDFHAYNGVRDDEHERVCVRDERGMVEHLEASRRELIRLLPRAREERGWAQPRGEDWDAHLSRPRTPAAALSPAEAEARIEQVLSSLEQGPLWLRLSWISGLREEAVLFRPALGWC